MKKVLIIDEGSFSRICSAILEHEGHRTEILEDIEGLSPGMDFREFGLIITSYPYGYFVFEKLKKVDIPTIILTDHINRDLIHLLRNFKNSYCMVKPLDYQKFRSLVKQVVSTDAPSISGYKIL